MGLASVALKQARDSNGEPIDDAICNVTAAAGTIFTACIPPRTGARAQVRNFRYTTGATAHNVTMMVPLSRTTVAVDAAAGATTVTLASMPAYPDGTTPAANDYVVLQFADGTWTGMIFSAVSGNTLTVAALAQAVNAAAPAANIGGVVMTGRAYLMGAPGTAGDHPRRVFVIPAIGTLPPTDIYHGIWATSLQNGDPILIHSDNATNAGTLSWCNYSYVPIG